MDILKVTLVVEEGRNAVRSRMKEEGAAWAVSDAVASAMAGLMDSTRFPNAVSGGPAVLVEDEPLLLHVPIAVDDASRELLDLLELGFAVDDPLVGDVNGALQVAIGHIDLQVDIVHISPA